MSVQEDTSPQLWGGETTKAVANFQPHQLNYKMLEDGKLVEASPEARAAVPRHEFVYN